MAAIAAICLILLQGAWAPSSAPSWALSWTLSRALFWTASDRAVVLAAAPQGDVQNRGGEERKLSPEETMNRRFPQPVKVGDLIGLPLLDYQDSTIGFIRQVVRTPEGKIQLVFPYGRWFGWVRAGGPFDWNRRLIAVPIEVVAILGRQVNVLDLSREDLDRAPDFVAGQSRPLAAGETIKIAIGRR
jgi:hypothetical protein